MKTLAFDVYLGNKKIDTVFYNEDFIKGFKTLAELKDHVKRGLIDHDGYDSRIEVI